MEITIQEIINQLSSEQYQSSDTALLDVQVLIAHHLEKPRTWVMAHSDDPLTEEKYNEIMQSAIRLANGVPLPYVLGHWEFYGLAFALTPDVLIPRPETELLVERAISWLRLHPHKRRVVDVGTGSGCIGIAIAKHIPDSHVVMTDISPKALNIARLNAEKHALLDRVEFVQSDLLKAVRGQFDLICANLPYIPTQALEKLPVAKSEPHQALDGGQNGLKVIQSLLKQAKSRCSTGGLMLLEIDPHQAEPLVQLAQQNYPLSKIEIRQDLSGKDRSLEIELSYLIFHLCRRTEWLISLARGEFRDESLARDGFIHLSQAEHIIEVANRYYTGIADVIVLWVDPEKLNAEIRWEKAGEVYYPHAYGPINLESVVKVTDLTLDSGGTYRTF